MEILYGINLKINESDLFDLNIKNKEIFFSPNTGRSLEYYTGIVFEIYKKSKKIHLASGGRYDNLMQILGSKRKIPAIGGAINYDNLLKI